MIGIRVSTKLEELTSVLNLAAISNKSIISNTNKNSIKEVEALNFDIQEVESEKLKHE